MSVSVMEERGRGRDIMIIRWKFRNASIFGDEAVLSGSCRKIAHTINLPLDVSIFCPPNLDLLSSSCEVIYTNDLRLLVAKDRGCWQANSQINRLVSRQISESSTCDTLS